MALYLGRGSAVGFGLESTWGTAVARTLWYAMRSCSVLRKVEKIKRGELHDGLITSPMRRRHALGKEEVTGTVVLVMTYEGIGSLLHYVMYSTPTTTGPSGSIYTHTILLATTPPSGSGLTLELIRGSDQAGGSAPAEVFEGVMINKMTIKAAVGDFLTVEFDFIGQTSSGRTTGTVGTLSASAALPMIYHQAGSLGWNSASFTCKSFELTLDRKLAPRDLLGSRLTAEPAPGDFTDCTIKVGVEYAAETFVTGWHADTESNLTITFTGTSSRTFGITAHNAYVDDVSDPISSYGVISQDVTLQAQNDGTLRGLTLVLENTQSSAIAA